MWARVKHQVPTQVLIGTATYIPGVYKALSSTGGTDSARYCYSVWLRHLVMAHKHGLSTKVPERIAELGPGDSLGIGLAALLSGSQEYYALDIVARSNPIRNIQILDELVDLYSRQADIPDEQEFPLVGPHLDSYTFPSEILPEQHLNKALSPRRIKAIRLALRSAQPSQYISYIVPWNDPEQLPRLSGLMFDMIFSQAVLEHVDDVEHTYQMLYQWLKPGGFMSHDIDFTCHGTHSEFNGHWTYPSWLWRRIRGNRAYLINRHPHSSHSTLMCRSGFEIVYDAPKKGESRIERRHLAPEYRSLSEEDLRTKSTFIQAVKR